MYAQLNDCNLPHAPMTSTFDLRPVVHKWSQKLSPPSRQSLIDALPFCSRFYNIAVTLIEI